MLSGFGKNGNRSNRLIRTRGDAGVRWWGIGDPRKATREKGKIYFQAVTRKLADLMTGLAETDPSELYG